MVKVDSMESAQNLPIWHNRRVQRSGAFAFIILYAVLSSLLSPFAFTN
jgi:hypothetical protein